ncbi:response regulator [candidate division KSB1 bacterium]|nr:response regulator [candidate division KSB1 bacterium]
MIQDKKIILIVDDETDLTWSMSRYIQRENPDIHVYSAVNGLQAFEMLHSIRPNLLITDLRMPGLNGFKLIEKARQLDLGLKVIVISAFYSREIESKLKSLGINDFLEKPFDLKKLRVLSDALLSIQNRVLSDPIQADYHLGMAS